MRGKILIEGVMWTMKPQKEGVFVNEKPKTTKKLAILQEGYETPLVITVPLDFKVEKLKPVKLICEISSYEINGKKGVFIMLLNAL